MKREGAGQLGTRGRVVMLVDNGVDGDSRVQKVARSAAEAGWEVILLGRAPVGQSRTWRLGEAEVRLIEMPKPLVKPRHGFRRRWLRGPLAYPPSGIAAHRAQWVKAWQADLRVRAASLALATGSGRSGWRLTVRRQLVRAESLAAQVLRRWVSFRYWQLTRAARDFTGPWDRLWTRFWQSVRGDRAWRRLFPHLWDFELAFGPVIDELAPDLIHAHDFRMVGVGARAAIRARAAGRPVKLVWDAHEFLPGVRPPAHNARWAPAHIAHEREYVPYADAAITVSESLAELLQKQHGLAERPDVILNAPAVEHGSSDAAEPVPGLRELCGIGAEVPLIVYSGAAAKQRGLDTMIEALPQLSGVHAALVVNKPASPYMAELLVRAGKLGVSGRVHVLPYVPHWQVVRFLSPADVGVIPIHHWPNHEIALITKFFEYSHARLPLVVSDVRTMAETVRSTGQGEVFRAEDVTDYVRALRAVLADPARYRAAYDRPGLLADWTWQAQAEVLEGIYRRLLPDRTHPATEPNSVASEHRSGTSAADRAGVPLSAPCRIAEAIIR